MDYRFSIEPTRDEHFFIAVRGVDGCMLMTSSPFARDRAHHAIETLHRLLERDWCYRIINRRNTGLRFMLTLPHVGLTCLSRPFSSCDVMEAEIQRLKTAAASTIAFQLDDTFHSSTGQHRGDEAERFAARLRELA